ncbi:MAG: hypothetical protein RR276_08760, partial [Angelakisella sp.]
MYKSYPHERKFFRDPVTGVDIVKLTAFPTTNIKLYFHVNAFTADSQTLVFQSYKENTRTSGIDLYKVNIDGTELTQLTDAPEAGSGVVSPDGKWVWVTNNGDPAKAADTMPAESMPKAEHGAMAGAGAVWVIDASTDAVVAKV